MTNNRERLIRCFRAVFPQLSEVEAPRASMDRVGGWDSVATATLTAVVEEEFEIQFDAEEIENLNSFQAFLDRVDRT
jgi:acyl carrier protein